jgi:mannose-6-phosphate isomerase-like protein (cupin superfamily)
MKPFVRKLTDYAMHNAPKGIKYWKIADGSSIQDKNEVDLVPVSQGKDIPGHIHERSNALVLVLSGSGIVELDTESKRIEKFDIVNIPAGTYHAFQASPSEELTFLSVQYPPIAGDYIFKRSSNKKFSFPRKPLTYAAAAIMCGIVLTGYKHHTDTEKKLRETEMLLNIEKDPYFRGVERGMLKYHDDIERMFGKENAKEIIRSSPYPLI